MKSSEFPCHDNKPYLFVLLLTVHQFSFLSLESGINNQKLQEAEYLQMTSSQVDWFHGVRGLQTCDLHLDGSPEFACQRDRQTQRAHLISSDHKEQISHGSIRFHVPIVNRYLWRTLPVASTSIGHENQEKHYTAFRNDESLPSSMALRISVYVLTASSSRYPTNLWQILG